MVLSEELIGRGFSLQDTVENDLEKYIDINRACRKKYMDEYNGGWIDDIQVILNTDSFHKMLKYSCFKKILQFNTIVGFFSFNELTDKICEISLFLTGPARLKGIEAFYLKHITTLSKQVSKPIFLNVYKSDPVHELYKQFGFKIYDQSRAQYIMSFNQEDTNDTNDLNNTNNSYDARSYMNRLLIKG
ncbi:hypothetical protein [Lacrimispora sp.]|uniref:hypothetical protein n=1 Tax=Lacrimispora sp. TaxID=2719234 RepID=UPI0028A97472|nr:hypothetical protein [Lacrimispora sp.]